MSYNRGKNWKKKQSRIVPKMEGFGMSYKDTEESGFSLDVNRFKSSKIVDDLFFMYHQLEKFYELDSDLIKKGKVSKEELIDGRTNDLKQSINDWNSYQNINKVEKLKIKRNGGTFFYDLSWDGGDRNFLEMIKNIMYGILFLINMGVIPNDNHNGFSYWRKVN